MYGGTSAIRKDEVGISNQPYSHANEAAAIAVEILYEYRLTSSYQRI